MLRCDIPPEVKKGTSRSFIKPKLFTIDLGISPKALFYNI